MTDLASSDLTITIQSGTMRITPKLREVTVKIAFGNATLTYPRVAGGVPLPAFGSFGMVRHLEDIILLDSDDASGIIWKYNREAKKLKAYIQGITVGAAGAATLDDFPLDTTADPLATAVSLSLTNNTGAGAKYLGKLLELAAAAAPPATVLYAIARGW